MHLRLLPFDSHKVNKPGGPTPGKRHDIRFSEIPNTIRRYINRERRMTPARVTGESSKGFLEMPCSPFRSGWWPPYRGNIRPYQLLSPQWAIPRSVHISLTPTMHPLKVRYVIGSIGAKSAGRLSCLAPRLPTFPSAIDAAGNSNDRLTGDVAENL